MKKNEQYRAAQIAVLQSETLTADAKLEIVQTLMQDEEMAGWREKYDAELATAKNAEEAVE